VWLSGFSCCSFFLAGVVGLAVVIGSQLFGPPFWGLLGVPLAPSVGLEEVFV